MKKWIHCLSRVLTMKVHALLLITAFTLLLLGCESIITLPAGSSAESVAELVKALNRHA